LFDGEENMSYRKNKPDKKPKEIELNDRLKALSKEYEDVGATYILSELDKQELLFQKYKQKYPESYSYEIQRLIRVQVPNKKDNYLVYVIHERLTDSRFQKHTLTRKIGWHPSPVGEITRNEYGELEDIDINQWCITFDIPFEPEKIRNLVAESRTNLVREMSCAKAAITGKSIAFAEPPHSIFNSEEFLTAKFDDLYRASELRYLKPEKGGVEEYLIARANSLQHNTNK
jgi:hypothetical protein